tara:strand:- start:337 stop:2304 length:1968 start_codon:yes stop_codon:yes gene_type:complete
MSIADLFGSVAPQYTMTQADRDQSANYESQIKAYEDAYDKYTQDYDVYKTGAENYNQLVKDYNDKFAAYKSEADAYNTALDAYTTQASAYNDQLAAHQKQVEDYNTAVEKYLQLSQGGQFGPAFEDYGFYVEKPGEFTAKRPDEFTMVRPGEFEVTKPEFSLTEPTAPGDPGFDQAELDNFIKASQGRARRRGAANAAALNVLGQGGNFTAGAGVQGGAGVSTTPEFSFSATGFADGGGVGEFFDSRLNFVRSYGVEPVTDINTNLTFKDAAKTVAEFTPIIGDAMAAKEIYDELTKEDPNYKLIAALGGAALIGAVPGIGDAAAAGIRKAADVARRIEVDPNALGSMGGNIRIKPSTEDLASEYLAKTEKTLKLQKIDRVIADGKVDNLDADEINRNVLSVASREGIPFPKRAFNDENVQYVSTKLINENLPRGNPPRYNVGEFFPIEDGVGKIAPATDLDVKKFLESEKKSLKEEIFSEGVKNPIEIKLSKKTGEAHIGEGHHRLDAALELGIEEVPIIVKVTDNELLRRFMTPIKVNTKGLKANENYSFDKINFLQRIERPRPPLNKPGEFAYDEFDRPLSLYGDFKRGGIDTIPDYLIKPMRPGMYRVRNVDKEYLSEAERELLRNSPDVPLVDKSKYADGGVVSFAPYLR